MLSMAFPRRWFTARSHAAGISLDGAVLPRSSLRWPDVVARRPLRLRRRSGCAGDAGARASRPRRRRTRSSLPSCASRTGVSWVTHRRTPAGRPAPAPDPAPRPRPLRRLPRPGNRGSSPTSTIRAPASDAAPPSRSAGSASAEAVGPLAAPARGGRAGGRGAADGRVRPRAHRRPRRRAAAPARPRGSVAQGAGARRRGARPHRRQGRGRRDRRPPSRTYRSAAFDVDPEDVSYPQADEVEAFRLGGLRPGPAARVRAAGGAPSSSRTASRSSGGGRWPTRCRRIEDPRAFDALTTLAGIRGSIGVAFAAQGLGALGDSGAPSLTLTALLDRDRRDARVVVSAVRALGALDAPEPPRPPSTASCASGTSIRMLRLEAVDALARHRSVAVDGGLHGARSRTPGRRCAPPRSGPSPPPIRQAFLRMLSGLGGDPDWRVRRAVADAHAAASTPRPRPGRLDRDARRRGRAGACPTSWRPWPRSARPDAAAALIAAPGGARRRGAAERRRASSASCGRRAAMPRWRRRTAPRARDPSYLARAASQSGRSPA